MSTDGASVVRAHYSGPAILVGDVVWHPNFGRGVISRLDLRVTEPTCTAAGVIHVASAPDGLAELGCIGVFTAGWMDLCLLRRQPGWSTLPGTARDASAAGGGHVSYPGEWILPGDLVYLGIWDVGRIEARIIEVNASGEGTERTESQQALEPRGASHGVVVSRGNSSDRESFPMGSWKWDSMRLIRHRPKSTPPKRA